jgi:hypothetical protein
MAVLSLFAPNRSDARPSSQPAVQDSKVAPLDYSPWRTRLFVTTYQLTLPIERAGDIDREKLQKTASSSQEFVAALKALGETRLLNLTDQFIGDGGPAKIRLGASRPTPTGSQSFKGQTSTQVQYQDAGCIIDVRTTWRHEDPKRGMVDMRVEFSGILDPDLQIAPGTMAPVIYQIDQKYAGPIRSGEPCLLISVDGSNRGSKSYAYITRVVFFRSEVERGSADANPDRFCRINSE